MTEDATDRFVVSGLVLKPDRSGGVSELVHGDEQASGFFDLFSNLTAEGNPPVSPGNSQSSFEPRSNDGLKWWT